MDTGATPAGEALAIANEASLPQLMRLAVERGTEGVQALERLVQLYREEQDRAAAKDFTAGLVEFHRRCPPIRSNTMATIESAAGGSFSYPYAELEHVASIVNPILLPLGFAYTWDSITDGTKVRVTCTLWHTSGHSKSASFEAPIDARSNRALSETQRYSGALTTGKRQTLVAVLGISTDEPDTDAKLSPGTITAEQAHRINRLFQERVADRTRFLAYYHIQGVTELPANRFEEAVKELEQRPIRSKVV